MGTKTMAEPTTSTAAGAAVGWKIIGGMAGAVGIGAALAALVVMCMTLPRTAREWTVGLTSTVMSSICGGAFVVLKLDLLRDLPHDGLALWVRLAAMIGVVFASGLPGWAIVRWTFNYIAKREGQDIAQVVGEARDAFKARLP